MCVCGSQVVNVLGDATEAFFFHVLSLQKLIALLYLFEVLLVFYMVRKIIFYCFCINTNF